MGTPTPLSTRRSFLRATGAAAAAVTGTGLASAGGKPSTIPGKRPAKKGNHRRLSLDLAEEIPTLDPIHGFNTEAVHLIEQLHDGLFDHPNGETDVIGALAADFTVNEAATTYTITLKKDVRFHDPEFGTVTAQDVVYSFERVAASPHSGVGWYLLDNLGISREYDGEGAYIPGSLGIRATNTRTVEIELVRPFHSALEVLCHTSLSIIPEGVVGDIEGYEGQLAYEEFATQAPIGAGPFALAARDEDGLHLDPFPQYHGHLTTLAGIDYHPVPDESARYDRAMDQAVDVFAIPDGQYDPDLATPESTDARGREFGRYGPLPNGPTVQYVSVTTRTTFYLGFNADEVPRPVRRACAWVLDQAADMAALFPGRSQPAYNFVPPNIYPGGFKAYTDHAQAYPYGTEAEVAQARQVMEAAGYDETNRYALHYTTWDSDALFAFGHRLADRLADAHIDVTVERVDIWELIRRGHQGALEAFALGWIADWAGADNFLQLLNPPHTDTTNPNHTSYFNWGGTPAAAEATAAWETIRANQGFSSAAEAARQRAAVTMEEANWTDAVAVPVMHRTQQRFWYDWVDIPPFGALGSSRQKLTDVQLRPPQSANGR